MDTKTATLEYRLAQWLPIIKECRASGMSVRDWCKAHDINEQQFYYRQRQLRKVATKSLPTVQTSSKFVALPIPNQSVTTTPIIIRIGQLTIEITHSSQTELLTSILKVINDVQ